MVGKIQTMSVIKKKIKIDDTFYNLQIIRLVDNGAEAIRLIIPVFIMSDYARDLLNTCLKSIQHFSNESEIEIWVVDNNSSYKYVNWLKSLQGINLVLNRSEPINKFWSWATNHRSIKEKFGFNRGVQLRDASYSNAIGLELGRLSIPQDSKLIMTFHSDTIVTHPNWLEAFKSKLSDKIRISAFRRDPIRVHAYHIAGLLTDYQLMLKLGADFLPNMRNERFPEKPVYDVGDNVTIKFEENGYEGFHLPNTGLDETLIGIFPEGSVYNNMHSCDRCFNENSEVVFVHMGRGAPKSSGKYNDKGKTYPNQWIEISRQILEG